MLVLVLCYVSLSIVLCWSYYCVVLVLVLCGAGRLNYCMTEAGLGLRAREDLIIQAASARPKFNPIIAA